MLEPGTTAPAFSLPDHEGNTVSLTDLSGRWVVLWWYPMANTPGCTIEGQTYRDLETEFEAAGAVIFGISLDSVDDNHRFATEQGFGYRLLSDLDRTVSEAYHAWRSPSEGEEARRAARRVSYLVDPQGQIAKAYKVQDIPAHPSEVLADIRALTG